MTILSDKQRTLNLLHNWKHWSRDMTLDPAEVPYYTVSPMFRDIVPQKATPAYDVDAALLVEDCMARMFIPYKTEWNMLRDYYALGFTQYEIAKSLGIQQSSVSRYRLPAAQRIFAEQWADMVRK